MWGPLITAMVTPFDRDLKVDYDKAAALAQHLVDTGSTGVLACGTTGESPTLTHDEELELIRVVRDAVGGQAKVLAGTGSNSTETALWMTRETDQLGIDGVMLVCPYYNRPTQDMLYAHFKTVAAVTELPVIIYNIPSRTGRNIEPKTMGRLTHEVANIVALKEATGDLGQFVAMKLAMAEGSLLYSGDDSNTPAILTAGGAGVISVASHVVGRPIRQMMDAFWTGDFAAGVSEYLRLTPIFNGLFPPDSVNPAPVKEALRLCGLDMGGLRPPLLPVSAERSAALKAELQRLNVI